MPKDNSKNKSWDDLIEDWILAYRKWFTKEAKEKVFRILYLYLRGKYLGNKSVEEQYNKITQKIMDKNMMKNQNKPSKLVFHRSEKKAKEDLKQLNEECRKHPEEFLAYLKKTGQLKRKSSDRLSAIENDEDHLDVLVKVLEKHVREQKQEK